jgi:hypothetical protein
LVLHRTSGLALDEPATFQQSDLAPENLEPVQLSDVRAAAFSAPKVQ